eukprot:9257837-Pyramimonas_sp.AAC.2
MGTMCTRFSILSIHKKPGVQARIGAATGIRTQADYKNYVPNTVNFRSHKNRLLLTLMRQFAHQVPSTLSSPNIYRPLRNDENLVRTLRKPLPLWLPWHA